MEVKKLRVIIIDAKKREVREEFHSGDSLKIMQQAVGGYIERGLTFENGDELYVNEEGLLKQESPEFQHWFSVYAGGPLGLNINGFVGNGIIVGVIDVENIEGDEKFIEKDCGSALSLLQDFKERVRFHTPAEIAELKKFDTRRVRESHGK